MHVCYVDESGSAELLCQGAPASTPVFVIAGLIVPHGELMPLVWDYLQVKKRYNPSLVVTRLSEVISTEIKGSDLRSDIRSGKRRRVRRATGIVDRVLTLVERHNCRLVGRIIVKDEDVPLNDSETYAGSISWICSAFHHYLESGKVHDGLVILDSRTKVKNRPNTHVITTQKFRTGGDPFPRLAEVPVFGHSDSHVALQLADIIASAVIFPMACSAYCSSLTWNQHPHPDYRRVAARYGQRIKALQYRYQDPVSNGWRGGLYSTSSSGGLAPLFAQSQPSAVP